MPRRSRKPDIWGVKPFRLTLEAFQHAYDLRRDHAFSVITAPAGRGKSFCAHVFVERHDDSSLAEVPPRAFGKPRRMVEDIARALDVVLTEYDSLRDGCRMIIDEMQNLGGLFILDEADRLDTSKADLLRWIAEEAGLMICLLGCPRIEQILQRHEPLIHRVGWRFEIPPITVADLQDAIPQTFPKDALRQIVIETRGNLRHVEVLISRLHEVKKTEGGKAAITPKVVSTVAHHFLARRPLPDLTPAELAELGLAA